MSVALDSWQLQAILDVLDGDETARERPAYRTALDALRQEQESRIMMIRLAGPRPAPDRADLEADWRREDRA